MSDLTKTSGFIIDTNIHDMKKLLERVCLLGAMVANAKEYLPDENYAEMKQMVNEADEVIQPIWEQVSKQQYEYYQSQTTQQ